jgi:hypothetical protein
MSITRNDEAVTQFIGWFREHENNESFQGVDWFDCAVGYFLGKDFKPSAAMDLAAEIQFQYKLWEAPSERSRQTYRRFIQS